MSNIILLDDNMINQIAAGEVIERPSSIVKELIENSIDAKSSLIIIEIKEGGISFIKVSDNGVGIEKEDIKNAFLRHATSKIKNIEDLENILTLGFRGEALASIASVSQVTMISKTKNENLGTKIELQGGDVVDFKNIASNEGTSITIRNLFYNTPGRRKFLKKISTESSYISDIINKFILGNPDISFKYIVNGTKILDFTGNKDLKSAIFNIYGKETFNNLIYVNCKNEEFELKGYIGKSEISRKNRRYGNLFLNGRYIKNKIVQDAIEEAFKTRLPLGKFPFYVLNLYINPSLVDVNVHPRKLEVRFNDEDKLYEFILNSINKVLKNINLIPNYKDLKISNFFKKKYNTEEKIDIDKENNINKLEKINDKENNINKLEKINIDNIEKQNYIKDIIYKNKNNGNLIESFYNKDNKNIFYNIKEDKTYYENINKEDKIYYEDINIKNNNIENNNKNKKKLFFNDYKIIGQVLNTYWILEEKSSIYMVDQHVAHERILYEKFCKEYKKEKIISQKLLEPQIIKISMIEKDIIENNTNLIEKLGFEVEIFSKDYIAIKSVPFILKDVVYFNFFIDILDKLSVLDRSIKNIYDTKLKEIATISCKAAIKANNKLNYIEIKSIIDELLKLDNPFTCPHGRPIIIEFKKYDIEKLFNRVQ